MRVRLGGQHVGRGGWTVPLDAACAPVQADEAMTEPPAADATPEPPTDFDWESPRWRENEAAPGEVERHRRSRIDDRPRQRGVLDQRDSVSASGSNGVRAEDPGPDVPVGDDAASNKEPPA